MQNRKDWTKIERICKEQINLSLLSFYVLLFSFKFILLRIKKTFYANYFEHSFLYPTTFFFIAFIDFDLMTHFLIHHLSLFQIDGFCHFLTHFIWQFPRLSHILWIIYWQFILNYHLLTQFIILTHFIRWFPCLSLTFLNVYWQFHCLRLIFPFLSHFFRL